MDDINTFKEYSETRDKFFALYAQLKKTGFAPVLAEDVKKFLKKPKKKGAGVEKKKVKKPKAKKE